MIGQQQKTLLDDVPCKASKP